MPQAHACIALGVVIFVVLGCRPTAQRETIPAPSPSSPVPSITPLRVASTPAGTPRPAPTKVVPTTGITKANFQRLSTGMSYAEVVRILGEEGEMLSESDVGDINTVMYMWKGDGISNMNAMFQNDRMISKAQFGLE